MIKYNLIISLLVCWNFTSCYEAKDAAIYEDTPSNETLDSSVYADEYYSGEMGTEKAAGSAPRLNATHGDMFKKWIDTKSDSLFQLSMNFSGYNLLNETYNVHLRRDAKFSWINFTQMIVNISDTISDVMYDKTLVVKKLSELVEKSYDQFVADTDKVINSTSHVYLDSKSPKTFCDVSETYKQKIAEDTKATTKTTTKAQSTMAKRQKQTSDHLYFLPKEGIEQDELIFYPNKTFRIENLKSSFVRPTRLFNVSRKYTKRPVGQSTMSTVPFYLNDEEEEEEYNMEDELDDEMDNYDLNDEYWDVECINRTYDENFKSVQKINKNESTIQVPINVYKQEIAMNMTAYWTEALDTQFKQNYNQDSDLFWQYFCSSNGLFRRYPAAYWSAPDHDFFDCRLQSWYIMAAASPKDVLILLDVSGSMTGLRLEIAKRLIDFILDTFTDNDFFNVLTFSNTVQYLFDNEPDYQDTFVQAGKANKLKFKEKLATYKNTSQQGRLTEPLSKVFRLFNESHLVRSGCNKMIMIITDGHADDVDPIFDKYNKDRRVRVFSFKIGRDMSDPSNIKNLACNNNGEYYHVVTLTDINEHVYEYIPVLSRPMALSGVKETTWSNVFIGYLDNELKIAVARPAFRSLSHNASHFKLDKYMNKSIDFRVPNYEQIVKKNKWSHGFHLTSEEQREAIENAEKELGNQDVFLGVVGVDVPVLKMISKVSPKYQMGVGIYIIMLDNNGFIVFHPSIKKEISESQYDYKGTSHSIEMQKFEIPIGNDYEFEMLEHDMIDQKTGNTTLNNWKREGKNV
ncbi:Voltage-dependent calcium channel subunit alpha-2 delta-4 [Brachionus plicatilis]|uniref:Voltage-dependent calcium channel subunit alpha-2 delta-4 n=1 Tax=Brachionus plicatilis TaxID=10195 RepID=A0A3M7SJQ9_BRAPC|nr:Voltage-dependent calcium channel subunit alpha-2 delta-4 [Brachionus plicatilis]